MDPLLVLTPRKKIKSPINILIKEEDFTIATFIYGKTEKIGIRWNKTESSEKGYPLAHGYPTWFILPQRVAVAYAEKTGNLTAYNALIRIEDGIE